MDGADVGRDAVLVVVEHDDQAPAQFADVVQPLEGHAARERAVADHRDDVVLLALQVARHGESQRRRKRGAAVTGAERIVFALDAPRVAGDSAERAQRVELGVAAGHQLVRVGLMPDVPHDAVVRGFEDAVERERQLDDAEIGRQVPGAPRHGLDDGVPDLSRELQDLRAVQRLQVGRRMDRIEQAHRAPHRYQSSAPAQPTMPPTRTSRGV